MRGKQAKKLRRVAEGATKGMPARALGLQQFYQRGIGYVRDDKGNPVLNADGKPAELRVNWPRPRRNVQGTTRWVYRQLKGIFLATPRPLRQRRLRLEVQA